MEARKEAERRPVSLLPPLSVSRSRLLLLSPRALLPDPSIPLAARTPHSLSLSLTLSLTPQLCWGSSAGVGVGDVARARHRAQASA